ncbi:MAG: thermonuclease family protein [Candidatus Saccharimonadales bacterium]
MTKRTQKKLIGLLVAVLVAVIGPLIAQKLPHTGIATTPGFYRVVDFADGDTISVDMNGTTEKIRFIGVDTPETHDPRKAVQCFGQAASDFTKGYIGKQPVRLEADPTNTNRDRYNRLLRYVYLQNGSLVNAEIIKQGYGFAYVSFPFTKLEEFKNYQKQAQSQKLGLWNSCQPKANTYGGYTSNDNP